MLEHPSITRTMKYGYPEPVDSCHWGVDYFGDEILFGDDIVDVGGDIVLQENLEKYLEDVLGFKFKIAK